MADAIDVDICANALIRLGEQPITSLDATVDESDAALVCRNLYPRVKENYLSIYNWRFSMKRQQLAKDSTTPINKWKYRYPLPSTAISSMTITVYNDAGEGVPAFKRYERFENFLWTDAEEIYIVFQDNVREELWAKYFVELMILAMAAELAFPVTDQQTTAEYWEKKRDKQFAIAKSRDAQHNPTRRLTGSRIIAARNRSFI